MSNGSTWSYTNLDDRWTAGDFCQNTRLSGDGQTVVMYCYAEEYNGGRLVTIKRTPANGWAIANSLRRLPWGGAANIAVTYSAEWVAVNGSGYSNGIGMYRWENSQWVLDVSILPSAFNSGAWAEAMEFSRHGEYLAIGDPSAYAHGAGVSDHAVTGTEVHGAVLLYKLVPQGIPMWYGVKQIMASNPDFDDYFGSSVAFGRLGADMAVGSPREDAAATGVDGDQSNDIRVNSGAVYLY